MDNSFSSADLEFQQEVRAFFTQEYTEDLRQRVDSSKDIKNVSVEWQKRRNWMDASTKIYF